MLRTVILVDKIIKLSTFRKKLDASSSMVFRQKTTVRVDPKNIGASYSWQLKAETASFIST